MNGRRLDALDGLRGLTAVGIVVLHVWMFDFGDAGRPDKGVVDLAIGELRLGVPLFFALSGFFVHRAFVAASLEGRGRPHLGRYATKRAARVLPGYWLALVVALLVTSREGHPLGIPAGDVPVFLLFAQGFDETLVKRLDPPMWTLGVEVTFYALLPLLAIAIARLTRRGQVMVCGGITLVGIVVVAAHALAGFDPTIESHLPYHLTAFGSGMFVVTLTHGRTLGPARARALLVAGVGLVVADAVWHALALGPQTVRDVGADIPASLGFALIIASYALHERRARLLGSFPARWAGTLSLGIYLMHYPAIVWLRNTDRWPQQLGEALLYVLAVTIPAALVSWFLVERPVLTWAAQRGRTAKDAAHRQGAPRPAEATA